MKTLLTYVPVHVLHSSLQQALEHFARVHGPIINDKDINDIIDTERVGPQQKSLSNETLFEIAKGESQKSLYALADVRVRTKTRKDQSRQKIKNSTRITL